MWADFQKYGRVWEVYICPRRDRKGNCRCTSNVKAFVWRLVWNRIQTRANLRRRAVIQSLEASLCPLWNKVEKCGDHLFFSCSSSFEMWRAIYNWFDVSNALSSTSKTHFNQFLSLGRNKAQRLGELVVWMGTVWSLWIQRNVIVFKDGAKDDVILDLIQMHSWHWINAKVGGFHNSLFEWKENLVACLSSM